MTRERANVLRIPPPKGLVGENLLLVPVWRFDPSGTPRVRSVQFISEHWDKDRNKRVLKDGAIGGGWCVLGSVPPCDTTGTIAIAESLGTAGSIHLAQPDWAMIIAFSAPNLGAVAETFHARCPQAPIVIIGDNDAAGQPAARRAAAAVGGLVAIAPVVTMADGHVGTDFNDLHVTTGLDAVREALDRAVAASPVSPL